uniref:Uncharacterized protein n=1 Tax=viral metagenome TaxID=1070528 RepID=A0A6C0BW72_9ZZZZ
MIVYIMYNGYNSQNQYLAIYKGKFEDKIWSHDVSRNLANCDGLKEGNDSCKGAVLKRAGNRAVENIDYIIPYMFDSPQNLTEIYKTENYFQDTGFPCYNNVGESYFSYPMLCDGKPCTRYNYIINNQTGSKNLLKNLWKNNEPVKDLEISPEEEIIPSGWTTSIITYQQTPDKILTFGTTGKVEEDISLVIMPANPVINLGAGIIKIKKNKLTVGTDKAIPITRIIEQHGSEDGIYHRMTITEREPPKGLLFEIDFKNYDPDTALTKRTMPYYLDNLFDTDITCKPITLPASGGCQHKFIHTKDYEYITKNHQPLIDSCAPGSQGFTLEKLKKTNKLYGKIFLSTFAMLILYMLYRIDRKRKT